LQTASKAAQFSLPSEKHRHYDRSRYRSEDMTKTNENTEQVVHDQRCGSGDLQGSIGEDAAGVHCGNQ
jgi:hypothetical protein